MTHSLGGILVRVYLMQQHLPELGRVVMPATPNQGMADFISMPAAHPFIAQNDLFMQQAMRFLATGRFDHAAAKNARFNSRRQAWCHQAAELTSCNDALGSPHPGD